MVLALVFCAALQDWPHWRGPDRNDIVAEPSGWGTASWPLKDPTWTGSVGPGGTSPIVAGGRLYTMGWLNDRDQVVCLDAATGRQIWTVSYPSPKYGRNHIGDENSYSGPTATPEFDASTGYLYTLGTDGDLLCWDTRQEGRRVWGLNVVAKYGVEKRPHVGAEQRDYGCTTAPLLFGEWIVVQVGSPEGTVMAFSKATGERRWASECRDPAGHGGGMAPITVEGVPCLALMTIRNLLVVRLDVGNEGKTAALYPWTTDFGNNVASPAVHGSDVLITSEYNHKAMCRVRVSLGKAVKVWEKPFSSKVCTPIISKGHVYWVWQKVRCLDFATGEQKWEGGDFGDAGSCILTSDAKLLVWGGTGRLSLVETAENSPDSFTELSRTVRIFQSTAWPHAALSNGMLFCKDRNGNLKGFVVATR